MTGHDTSRPPAGAANNEVPLDMSNSVAADTTNSSTEPRVTVEEDINRPKTPPSGPSAPKMTQIYAALQAISPTSQKLVRDTLTNTLKDMPSPDAILTPKLLFSITNETISATPTSNTGYGIHPFIISLAENGSHIPLSLFTTSATNLLHTSEASIPQKSVINRLTGLKRHIIDIKYFQGEDSMDIGDWHEAWTRYHRFVETHGDKDSVIRWKKHHEFLAEQDNLKRNFAAILKFDIETRTKYNLTPSPHDEDSYRRRFEAIKLEVLQAEILAARPISDVESNNNTVSFSSWKGKSRYAPYNHRDADSSSRQSGSRTENVVASSNNHSFRSSGASSTNTPICLICQREHRFATCQESITQAGKQTTAKYDNRKLVRRSDGGVICIAFNLNRLSICSKSHSDHHICSFCGASDHGACSRKCI
ncbi:hypothetical protein K443DRAFT_116669 [Laccaria amethystina LaAM-08-1]|uniref:Uncharacterized protein n=1 Tax=Laccaria amethystina LaAM-08-1 TaxID=1095629 RepID=A0A0C9WRA6_9AGAR|nr:hypothetical protein K443DRAFT_116669 [Laccaria amethystina LaAM-08-1]